MPQDSKNQIPQLAIKLQGGIGNQLFQQCFAEYLSQGCDLTLAYLVDGFSKDPYGRKNIVKRLLPNAIFLNQKDLVLSSCRLLNESVLQGTLDPVLLKALLSSQGIGTCILEGYWQDLRYISQQQIRSIKKSINDLKDRSSIMDYCDFQKKILESKNSIAVHVRRHDYKHHGICEEMYYIDSLNMIKNNFKDTNIFVFSDEPNYSDHFLRNAGFQTTITGCGDDLLDLLLIAQCKIHVIANSTYSWWGAMLSESICTIYPKPWSLVHQPSTTMFPVNWHAIEGAVQGGISKITFLNQFHLQR